MSPPISGLRQIVSPATTTVQREFCGKHVWKGHVNTQRSMCTSFKTAQWSCTVVHETCNFKDHWMITWALNSWSSLLPIQKVFLHNCLWKFKLILTVPIHLNANCILVIQLILYILNSIEHGLLIIFSRALRVIGSFFHNFSVPLRVQNI